MTAPTATTAACQRCGGCRVASLVWCGGIQWRPVPCPDCSPCPDPDGHRREHASHEVTIRARAEGRPLVEVEGQCPYCGGAA